MGIGAGIGAALGIGSSVVGGIQGKHAAKEQAKQAAALRVQMQPILNSAVSGAQYGLGQAQQLIPQATGGLQGGANAAMGQFQNLAGLSNQYLQGAGNAFGDLNKFYGQFMQGGTNAIDQFLPSSSRVYQTYAPQFGNIAQGTQSALSQLGQFAPRGGGQASAYSNLLNSQNKQMSDLFFQGKNNIQQQALGAAFQGAQGKGQTASGLAGLGMGTGSQAGNYLGQDLGAYGNIGGLGTSLFSGGMQGLGNASNLMGGLFNAQQGRAFQAQQNQAGYYSQMGSFLADIFNPSGAGVFDSKGSGKG